jgi:hypothetical protein
MSNLSKSIKMCSDRYGFDYTEAMLMLNSDNETYPLPFNKRTVSSELCQGLSYNNGLYTQCTKVRENDEYCKGCLKESQNDDSRIPICGNIKSRLNDELMLHTDRKGRKPTQYLQVLKKLNLPLESVLSYAKTLNVEIEQEHLTLREKDEKDIKQKRGRPSKVATIIESAVPEDLFATLVAETITEIVAENAKIIVESIVEPIESVVEPIESVVEPIIETIVEPIETIVEPIETIVEPIETIVEPIIVKTNQLKLIHPDDIIPENDKIAQILLAKEEAKAKKLAEKNAKEEAKAKKLAEKNAKEEAKLDKEALSAKKLADKEALNAKKLADKEALIAKKLADKESAKEEAKAKKLADKEAAKEEAKAKKLADKESAKEEAKAKKLADKEAAKEEAKAKKKADTNIPNIETKVEETKVEETKVVSVQRIVINGISYLKSKQNNILYNQETKLEMGVFNEDNNGIIPLPSIIINDIIYLKSSTNTLYDEKGTEELGKYDENTNTLIPYEDEDDEEEEYEEYDE